MKVKKGEFFRVGGKIYQATQDSHPSVLTGANVAYGKEVERLIFGVPVLNHNEERKVLMDFVADKMEIVDCDYFTYKFVVKETEKEPIVMNYETPNTPFCRMFKEVMDEQNQEEDYINDLFVDSVVNKMRERSKTGYKKYGTNLEREDLSTTQWLTHLQEELMDGSLYAEKVKHTLIELSKFLEMFKEGEFTKEEFIEYAEYLLDGKIEN